MMLVKAHIHGILSAWRSREYPVRRAGPKNVLPSMVDLYWAKHLVSHGPFRTASESKQHLEWRFSVYPLFREFSQLYGRHDNQVILDYGCGSGNDVIGFGLYSQASKIIGLDVSTEALRLTRYRLALHRIPPGRIELTQISDSAAEIPLADRSVDHVNCQGVLMHTSRPEIILREFYRISRPGSTACIMVYNCDSLWLHLFTAYQRMLVEGAFDGLTVCEAFARNTDGADCPISRCYGSLEFVAMCREAGFEEVEYVGGYLSSIELQSLHKYGQAALESEKLSDEHRAFLRTLEFDARGFPMHEGKHAGIGGTYWLART